MIDAQKREAARNFINKWKDKGREDEDARSFWIDIMQNILGVQDANDRAVMEAYDFNVKTMFEADCVAALMRRYQELTAK